MQTPHLSHHPDYLCWTAMKRRCYYPRDKAWEYYGGRGITVCDRWLSQDGFANFLNDMGPRPGLNYSIERIDNNGNYEPTNCRWATRIEQHRNKRNNRLVTLNDRTQSVAAWAEELGVAVHRLHSRLKRGWPVDQMLTPGKRKYTRKPHA